MYYTNEHLSVAPALLWESGIVFDNARVSVCQCLSVQTRIKTDKKLM